MKINPIPHDKGFSLVEVMIALVVLAVGILGISQLQSKIIRSASDSHARAVAATIAQNKIDDLRSFVYLTSENIPTDPVPSPANSVAFTDISDNTGGLISSGNIDILEMDIESNTAFELQWDVTDYYYDDVGFSAPTTTPPVAGAIPSFKLLEVNVSWVDVEGNDQGHIVKTVIDGYAPQFTARFGTSNTGAEAPLIPYTPQAAPDVIPVTLDDDGLKKETSKPLPDISKKGFSVATSFENVTYNTVLDTVRREDFLTLSCRCGSGATVSEHVLGRTVWDVENLKLKDEIYDESYTVNESVVNDAGGEAQAPECGICCRDAPDETDEYKSCRLKRIDGVMRYFEQWKMVALNIIPASYFDQAGIAGMDASIAEANIGIYSDYVTALVRERLAFSENDFDEASTDVGFPINANDYKNGEIDHLLFSSGSDPRQIQVRAVYMDYPPSEIYDECGTGPCGPTDVPLDRVSFFEVNITNLAGWMPDKDQELNYLMVDSGYDYTQDHDAIRANDCSSNETSPSRSFVTNDELINGCEAQLSRGLFDPGTVATSTAVQTIIFESNDGLVNRATSGEATVPNELELVTQ